MGPFKGKDATNLSVSNRLIRLYLKLLQMKNRVKFDIDYAGINIKDIRFNFWNYFVFISFYHTEFCCFNSMVDFPTTKFS